MRIFLSALKLKSRKKCDEGTLQILMLSGGASAFSVPGNLHSVADCNCCFAPCASHDLKIGKCADLWILESAAWQFGTVCCWFAAAAAGEFSQLIYPERGGRGAGRSVVLFTKN